MTQNFLSLLSSVSNNPLKYWNKQKSLTGAIHSVLDQHLSQNVQVVELRDGNKYNFEKTSITCPTDSDKILNITLPFLVIIIKNVAASCLLKLQIIDKNKNRYYLLLYNEKYEKRHTIATPNVQIIMINFDREWNKIELNLPKLIWQAFQTSYEAVQRLQICGNCRLRRIYFIDKVYAEYEISTKLCQNFFECYMSKWGVSMTERSTQTEKHKCATPNNTENIPVIYMNFTDKQNDKYFEEINNKTRLIKVESNFWKLLRASCRHTIDNFFNINTKTTCCLKNPKFESLITSGVEKQKIILANIKFINNLQNTTFSVVKNPFQVNEKQLKSQKPKSKVQ